MFFDQSLESRMKNGYYNFGKCLKMDYYVSIFESSPQNENISREREGRKNFPSSERQWGPKTEWFDFVQFNVN